MDLNDPNTTNLDLTIHAHLNSSIVSTNKQAVDKETVEKQKHEVKKSIRIKIDLCILFKGSFEISFLCCTNDNNSIEIID